MAFVAIRRRLGADDSLHSDGFPVCALLPQMVVTRVRVIVAVTAACMSRSDSPTRLTLHCAPAPWVVGRIAPVLVSPFIVVRYAFFAAHSAWVSASRIGCLRHDRSTADCALEQRACGS
jgi:hypothetical protein